MPKLHKFKISVNDNYDNTKEKRFNHSRVSSGWKLIEVDWTQKALENLATKHGILGSEMADGSRKKAQWVGTHCIMLDFDDGSMTIDDIKAEQEKWKFASYAFVSQNHQLKVVRDDGTIKHGPVDKLRVLIPLAKPIRNALDRKIIEQIFITRHGASLDATFMQENRYFAHGRTGPLSNMTNKDFLDWETLPGYTKQAIEASEESIHDAQSKDSPNTFTFDDATKDQHGNYIKIRDLKLGDPIFCPICGDAEYRSNNTHNAVYSVNRDGIPMIYCSSCESRNNGVSGKGVYNLHPDDAFAYKAEKEGFKNFVFLDIESQKYKSIRENLDTGRPRISTVANEKLVQTCKTLNLPMPEVFPQLDVRLEFDSDELIDMKRGVVNTYVAPEVLKLEPDPDNPTKRPPTIHKLIDHVVGHDEEVRNHLYNSLAHLVQNRRKLITTYLFQGTEGTGKGTLFTEVLRPIFGENYCTQADQSKFGNQFNSMLADRVIVLINEVEADLATNKAGNVAVVDKMKQAITDKDVEIERKGKDTTPGSNQCSLFFATNKHRGLILSHDDRRFTIAPRQEVKIKDTDWWKSFDTYTEIADKFRSEIPDFVMYLKQLKIDYKLLENVVENKPRKALQGMSTSVADDFLTAVATGEFEWFNTNFIRENYGTLTQDRYVEALAILKRIYTNGIENLRTNQIDIVQLYNYMNRKNLSVTAFGKMAATRLPVPRQYRFNGQKVRGYEIKWDIDADHKAMFGEDIKF